MLLVNVSPQVSADVCKVDVSGPMRTARGADEEGVKNSTLMWTFLVDEPISCNLSRNLNHHNAKL